MRIQWEDFAHAILEGKKPVDAAIAAGYSERSAISQSYRLLKNDEIVRYIAKRREKLREKVNIGAAYIIEGLRQNAEEARAEGQYKPSNHALELLGKHLGLFIDRSEVTITNEVMELLDEIISLIDEGVASDEEKGLLIEKLSNLKSAKK